MTTSRRTFLKQSATAASLLAAGALAGCGKRSPAHPILDAQGRRIVRFWNGFTGPDGKTMERMVAQFRTANPDLAVSMQIIPWGTYYDKLTLSLAFGGAPDLFVCHAGRLPEFASFGALRPLTDLYAAAGDAASEAKFAPVPWHATFYKSAQYALPLDVHPQGLYYNTELFERAGIVDAAGKAKPPVTWNEFLHAAQALTRTGKDGQEWGFVLTWQRTNYMTFLAQFGGAILSPDGKQGAMGSPQSVAALTRMRDLITRYKVAPRPEGIDAWLNFRQGKVGMALEGIYMLSGLQEQKGLRFAGAPAPHFGEKPGVWGGSHLLALPRGATTEAANAAWRLARFLSDTSIVWAGGGQVPARSDIRESPAFAAMPVQSQFARQIDYVYYDPPVPQANALFPFVDPAIEAGLLGLDTPENTLRDADRRINQILERA